MSSRTVESFRTKSSGKVLRAAEGGGVVGLRVLGSNQTAEIDGACFTVGSGDANDLVLVDPYVSRHHCSVLIEDGDAWVQDEGSRNGTWVNELRVDRCRVWPGARIGVGQTGLQLLGESQLHNPHGIVGCHPLTKKVIAKIERLGPSLKPVLILGETGTGKELVARALHTCSPCYLGVFEPLNCGAIPRDLAEAELFGHDEGAFTGASRLRRGAFERADGGTLFLDEVGEMPLELQPKLLRVLEEGMVQRIGEEQWRRVEVRVLAATHRDLIGEVGRDRFRLDLYHRLAVGVIEIPPLRERPEDIPLLVDHFMQQESPGLRVAVPQEVVDYLKQLPWHGNVRELRNAVQRSVTERPGELRVEDFRGMGLGWEKPAEGVVRYRGRIFRDIQREVYTRVLDSCGWNRSAAANALGIPKSTFFDQLKALRLGRKGSG